MLGEIFNKLGENTRMAREQEAQKQDEAVSQRVSLLKSLAGQLDPNSPTHAQDIAQLMEWAEHPFGDTKQSKKSAMTQLPSGAKVDGKEYRGHLAQVLAGLNKFAHQFGHGARLVGEHIGPFYQAAKTPAPLDTAAIQRMVGSAEDRSKWDTEAQQREVQAKLGTAKLIASNLQLKEGTEEYSNFIAQYVTGKGLPKADVIKLNPNQIATDAEGNKIAEGKPTPPKPEKTLTTTALEEQVYANHIGKPVSTLTPRERLEARVVGRKMVAPNPTGNRNATAEAGSSIPESELRVLAQREIKTGVKPSFGLSAKDPNRARYNRILADELTNTPDYLSAIPSYKAGSANLAQLTKIKGVIGSLEGAFKLDIQNALDASDKVPRTDLGIFNKWEQIVKANLTDHPELASFRVAVQTAVNQYARIMSAGAGGGSRTTVNAQQHAEELINAAMPSGTLKSALDQMKKEADNTVSGVDQQIQEQTKGMSGSSQSGNQPGKAFQIKVNGKLYTYKGSGSSKDLANYTESK